MAEKTSFVLGVLGADFEQLKTSDNVYLKNLINGPIESSLEEYNSLELSMTKLQTRRFDDPSSKAKRTFTSDAFEEIGELQTPGMYSGFEVWNHPSPIKRLGSLTMMTRERVQLMSSTQFLAFHNAKLEADQKNITKSMFQAGMVKAPVGRVDALDGEATGAKAFWNDEAGMDTPRANGQLTFDGDHDHYNVETTIGLAGVNLSTHLIDTINEHEGMSGAQIVIWAQSGATANLIKAQTTYFRAIQQDSAIIGALSPQYQASGRAQAVLTGAKYLGYNVKVVGVWKDAIVIETPEIPANYIYATAYMGDGDMRAPIGWREHPAFKGLVIIDDSGGNPIIGKDAQYRRYLGLHVNNRSAGAVLFLDAGAWAEPTFS